MSWNRVFSIRSLWLCPLFLASCVSPSNVAREQEGLVYREMRIEVDDFRYKLENVYAEMQILGEKLDKQLASKREERESLQRDQHLKEEEDHSRFMTLEKRLDSIITDVRQLASHANDTTASLTQYKKKIKELEEGIEVRNKHLEEELRKFKETAKALISLMEKKKQVSSGGGYIVKEGDSLERIARKYNTTVEELKKVNRLESDLIVIGQELRISD